MGLLGVGRGLVPFFVAPKRCRRDVQKKLIGFVSNNNIGKALNLDDFVNYMVQTSVSWSRWWHVELFLILPNLDSLLGQVRHWHGSLFLGQSCD